MSVRETYSGKYLAEPDLQKKEARVVIKNVGKDEFDGNEPGTKVKKIVLGFEGKEKELTLNKTNANIIADAYGDEELDWIGKEIIMYPSTTLFKGKIVPCIKVRVDMPAVEGEEETPF